MLNLQYSRDVTYKLIKPFWFTTKKYLKDNTNLTLTSKITDRGTLIRLRESNSALFLQGTVIKKIFSTEEYIKEKKNIKKKIEMKLNLNLIKKDKKKMFFFISTIKNIIKKKIYKRFSPTFYLSIPSIKINYIPENSRNQIMNYFQHVNKI